MGLHKAQAAQKPTALGTLQQTSAYGMTEPTIYGTARSVPLWIWAANLRKGGSGKKFKGKKGPPTYVENIDGMLGSNPIRNVLQIWSNQSNAYPLQFNKIRVNANAGGSWHQTLTVSDPNFYAICAVTMECIVGLATTFDDFGAPGSVEYQNESTTLYEFPLWNADMHGPDVLDPGVSRFPHYYWKPSDGPTINIPLQSTLGRLGSVSMPNPSNGNPFGATFNVYIYYAATTSITKHESPMQYNRFEFEQVLGSGDEYANAGNIPGSSTPYTTQQRLYPEFAGIQSSDMDLGSVGAIPSWRMEIDGAYTLLPPDLSGETQGGGDAEFADMVEDIVKSGVIQTLNGLGYIHRGCNLNSMPGTIQKNWWQLNGPSDAAMFFPQPNTAGNILLGAARWQRGGPGGTPPTISDTAGDAWTNIFASAGESQQIVSYVNGCIGGPGNIVNFTYNGTLFADANDAYILEFDPGSTAVDGAPVVVTGAGTPGTLTASITTTGRPSYIVAICLTDGGFSANINPGWNDLFPQAVKSWSAIYGRSVSVPGTYTFSFDSGGNDATLVLFALKSTQVAGTVPYVKAIGNVLDYDTLYNARLMCRCGGLQGSLAMNSQRNAADWLDDIYACMNTAPVWSGFHLKSIAYSEVSQIGDGSAANVLSGYPATAGLASCFWSPTANGPAAVLTEADFVADSKNPAITVDRKAQVPDADNVIQIQCFDRNNQYNQALVSEPLAGATALNGTRKASPKMLPMIVDTLVARKIAAIMARRKVSLRNVYKFVLKAKFMFLEAMDVVVLPNDSQLGTGAIAVRLTKVVENANYELECEAEQFIYGLHNPDNLSTAVVAPYQPNLAVVPAAVNPPVFLEPPTAMTINDAMELWIGVSDSDPNYGGCVVYVSTDGTTYNDIGTISGSAVTGILTQDWPAGLDPDFVNDLKLDLTESLGTLDSYSVVDMNNFVYPFYVEGSTTCGFEIGAYSTANMTAPNIYTIPASPNGIRRDVYHQPLSGSVDHPIGKRFLFLGAASAASTKASAKAGTATGAAILKLPLQPQWEGQTLYFKFQAFNIFGSGFEDISGLTVYTYVPGACALIPAPDIVTIQVASSAPGTFAVPHGLLYTPLFAIVQMTSGGQIVLQRPLSVDATNVYLNASAAGLTANVSLFAAPADASVPLSPSTGGAFSVPHGLSSTPTLSLVQLDSMGDIWKGSPPYTSSVLNLIAAAGPLTGKDYVWITPPRTPTLTRFVSIALAPGAPGNFSVPHGLGVIPKLVIVRMSSGGNIYLQSSVGGDITNLLLTATAGGITGEAEVWA